MSNPRFDRSFIETSPADLLARLSLDAGARTYGELVQDRQLAVSEILRLRKALSAVEIETPPSSGISGDDDLPISLFNERAALLSVRDLSRYLGIARSTIYALLKQEHLPPPLRIGNRTVRWRYEDIEIWKRSLMIKK